MKSKVIIENSRTIIELFPENDFEKEIIERSSNKRLINATAYCDFTYGHFTNHKIELEIGSLVSQSKCEKKCVGIEIHYNRAIDLLQSIEKVLKKEGALTATDPLIVEITEFMSSPSPL
jgi:hypothetical protein